MFMIVRVRRIKGRCLLDFLSIINDEIFGVKNETFPKNSVPRKVVFL